MKKQIFKLSLIILSGTLLLACKKDDPEPAAGTPTAIDRGSFSWTAGASAHVNADSAFYYSQFTTIFAFKNGNNNSIEINLSALSAGTYSFSSATGNDLSFVTGTDTYTAVSGSCNITAAANNKLSGSFSAALAGGTLSTLSGTFQNILKK